MVADVCAHQVAIILMECARQLGLGPQPLLHTLNSYVELAITSQFILLTAKVIMTLLTV